MKDQYAGRGGSYIKTPDGKRVKASDYVAPTPKQKKSVEPIETQAVESENTLTQESDK